MRPRVSLRMSRPRVTIRERAAARTAILISLQRPRAEGLG
jgi:hypothetical protein